MNIDEYLNQLPALKRAADYSLIKASEAADRVTATSAPPTDGIAYQRSRENTTEIKLTEYADTIAAYRSAQENYKNLRKKVYRAIYQLQYNEGIMLETLYIFDPSIERKTNIMDFSEMLETTSRREILQTLETAKQHLRLKLIEQGAVID